MNHITVVPGAHPTPARGNLGATLLGPRGSLVRGQFLFALLSGGDLLLTTWLLAHPAGEVEEANPLARWWLERLGLGGLAAFKAAVVGLVLLLTLLIWRVRPRTAQTLLRLGCLVLAAVLLYSAGLCWAERHDLSRCPEARNALVNQQLEPMNADARRTSRRIHAFWAALVEDLTAGRCSLVAAGKRIEGSERGRDPVWRSVLLGRHPGRPAEQAFAACAMGHAITALQDDPPRQHQLARRLACEFRESYGVAPPPPELQPLPGGPSPVVGHGGLLGACPRPSAR